MQLEIFNNATGKLHLGSHGFIFVMDDYTILSALKTDDGLYVAERAVSYIGQLELFEANSESEILGVLRSWLSAEDQHLLDGLRFVGFTHKFEASEKSSLKSVMGYLRDKQSTYHSYCMQDEAVSKSLGKVSFDALFSAPEGSAKRALEKARKSTGTIHRLFEARPSTPVLDNCLKGQTIILLDSDIVTSDLKELAEKVDSTSTNEVN
jgi:hypothetical protein